jgi:hypothetical protein
MVTARRALAGIAILGVVVALVVIQQRRDDGADDEVVDGALAPIDDAGTTRQAAPTAAPETDETSSPPSTLSSDAEAVSACAQILDDARAFAEMERNAADPPVAEASRDQADAEWDNMKSRLAASPDPESFLTAFLMNRTEARVADDSSAQARLLDLGLRAADSDSPLLAWHALRACVEAEEYCPFPHLEQSLLEADQDNADAWALVATLRYRRGDVAGALDAMQDAARASTSTWYSTETMGMIERSLAEQTSLQNLSRVAIASTYGMAFPADSSQLMCRVESASSGAWGEACLAFGKLRGEHNESDLARLVGYRIREQTLTALGDLEGAAKVAEENALYVAGRIVGGRELSGSIYSIQTSLLATNPDRWPAYLRAFREFGEAEGTRVFLRAELPPLLERAGLLVRDGARECVAQVFEAPAAVGTVSTTFRDYPVEEYPLRVGDQLQLYARGQNGLSGPLQVGPGGTITLPRVRSDLRPDFPAIAAVGKTTAQIEREIVTMLSERDPSSASLEVIVTLVAPRSSEELQFEFDDALREAADRRDEPR